MKHKKKVLKSLNKALEHVKHFKRFTRISVSEIVQLSEVEMKINSAIKNIKEESDDGKEPAETDESTGTDQQKV